ncbi:hypothetical protein NQ317_006941 [Molorchus minor]|uniref:Uncharacterized protein n=1 Tax=Molorchus minor TaxID=1323400 RepID=A0ABQ9JPL6_9CUCU|nr:hypothetical protein NQ317_006941 [Molorchus minor]
MLLVMDSAKVFDGPDGKSPMWNATWERIGRFLPNLKDELNRKQIKMWKARSRSLFSIMSKNATRSSIILQPPSSQQPVSSHLFAHLGQMVSTPIGSSYTVDTSQKPIPITTLPQVSNNHPTIPNSTTPILQPTLQTGMPYMSNLSPTIPSTTTTEVQPVSLYAEYMGNPYNVPTPDVYNLARNEVNAESIVAKSGTECESQSVPDNTLSVDVTNVNLDLNKNSSADSEVTQNNNPTNFFQSSNYFSSTATPGFIPVGSEILFGVQQGCIQGVNIPVTNSVDKNTTDV